MKTGGSRPKPRVALVGKFSTDEIARYQTLFPTVWSAASGLQLKTIVQPIELDLFIIGRELNGFHNLWDYAEALHTISFLDAQISLPGPVGGTAIQIGQRNKTEQFKFPSLPLALSRQRENDLSKLTGVKGWSQLSMTILDASIAETVQNAISTVEAQIILADAHTDIPLAISYWRPETNLGFAWLPSSDFDQFGWTETLVLEWAKRNPASFPGFSDWTKSTEWMTSEEENMVQRINDLEQERLATATRIDKEIGELMSQLTRITLSVNSSSRRLITAQGSDLVDEVASVFARLGYIVQKMDDNIESGQPKREDLRLQDPDDVSWEAIVEVRGYAKSGGTTSDFQRLARFASFYQIEKGKLPDKRIYVVNGQIELGPSQCDVPFSSAKEDLLVFAEDQGLVIWTLDLFRIAKISTGAQNGNIRKSIKEAFGCWRPAFDK